MRRDDVRDELLVPADGRPDGLAAHLPGCTAGTSFAGQVLPLDHRLRAALILEPPPELQLQLLTLARVAGRAGTLPGPGAVGWLRDLAAWLAALTLALASWQLYAWLVDSTLVLGDVPGALGLAASPALEILGNVGLDPLSAALWAVAALVAWLVAERGPPPEPTPA